MNNEKGTIKIITPTPVKDDDKEKHEVNHEDYNNREMFAIEDRKTSPIKLIIALLILGAIIAYIVLVTIPSLNSIKLPEGFIQFLC